MKKLMIAVAATAVVGSVSAAVAQYKPYAQVYDAALTVKTTACKQGKFTAALEKFDDRQGGIFGYQKGDVVQFRKQATRKIAGMFWGCDCETIADPAWRLYVGLKNDGVTVQSVTVGGYAFWDATSSKAYIPFTIPYVSFQWMVLNRIDNMTKVEGTWVLRDRANDEALFLVGAGFGTANNAAWECNSYIKNIAGSFAGYLQYASGGDDGCVFCGTTDYNCLVAPFCWCQNVEDTTFLTAAFGTWSIKYNATSSRKLQNAGATTFTAKSGKKYKTTTVTVVPTYSKKAFKAGDPSVVDAITAEEKVIRDQFAGDSNWDDIVWLFNYDGKPFQDQIDFTPEEVLKLKDEYFKNLDGAQTDPGDVMDNPDFPETAKSLMNFS